MTKSTMGKILLAIIILSIGLFIFFKDVDLHNLYIELKTTSVSTLICGGCFLILSLFLRSLRWRLLLPESPGTNRHFLFGNICIGFMVNNVLPARIGEITRAFILWKKNKFPISICIGTLIIERCIDIIIFLSFFAIPVFLLPQCKSLFFYAQIALAIIITALICLLFYGTFRSMTHRILKLLVSIIPEKKRKQVIHLGNELESTMEWLYSIPSILYIIILSIFIGLCYAFIIIILANKHGMIFGIFHGMFIQAYAAFGAAIPLSPGYIGTLHAAMLQGLNILAMNGDQARALAIIYHGLSYCIINILGLFFIVRIKLSFKEIFAAKKNLNR